MNSPKPMQLHPEERWPYYADDEVEAVAVVLRSGKVNQWTGSDVFAFEKEWSERFGGGRAIALANGSLALELALRAFRIGPGDEVIVSPRSFVASASCVRLVGATPIFADVHEESGNLTSQSVRAALTDRTRAVIPVHLAGWPADVPGIMEAVAGSDIMVIEDCAQAHGAQINGKTVGSFGDAAAFSFCQDKIISTAGEGGLLTLNDEAAWNWAWSFKDHGKSLAKTTDGDSAPGMFRFVHDMVGTNWRMPGPQAAIGRVQLRKVNGWLQTRSENAAIWAEALGNVPGLRIPLPCRNSIRHAFYKLYFYVDSRSEPEASVVRAEILRRAAAEGLRVFSGTCSEIYLERAFSDLSHRECPVSRSLGARSMMVEVHPTLRPDLLKLRADRLAQIAQQVLEQR